MDKLRNFISNNTKRLMIMSFKKHDEKVEEDQEETISDLIWSKQLVNIDAKKYDWRLRRALAKDYLEAQLIEDMAKQSFPIHKYEYAVDSMINVYSIDIDYNGIEIHKKIIYPDETYESEKWTCMKDRFGMEYYESHSIWEIIGAKIGIDNVPYIEEINSKTLEAKKSRVR